MIHKYKKFQNNNGDRFVFVNTSCKNIPARNTDFTKDFLKDECKMEVIGFVDELVEEDWGKIVDFVWVDCCDDCGSGDIYYPNYLAPDYMDFNEDKYYYYDHWFISNKESGKTLLDSLNIDINNNWVLIKYL